MIWIAPSEKDTNAALRVSANPCRATTGRDRSNNRGATEYLHDLSPAECADASNDSRLFDGETELSLVA